jgi:hypothetical protein
MLIGARPGVPFTTSHTWHGADGLLRSDRGREAVQRCGGGLQIAVDLREDDRHHLRDG